MKSSESGYPQFSKTEILTKEQIKPYFSKGAPALRKQIVNSIKGGGKLLLDEEGACE
jgi:hypothetical protein